MEYQDSLYSFINLNPETQMVPSFQSDEEFKSELVLNFSKNPLFEHLILHIKSYLKSFSTSSKDKSKVSILSDFLNTNKFDNKILKQIIKDGIPNKLPCLRAIIWKTLIGYYPINDLTKWKLITMEHFKKYQEMKKFYKEYPKNVTDEEDMKTLIQIDKDLPRTRNEINFFKEKSKFNKDETNYDILRRILFFFAKRNNDLGYVQGLNEIAAIIYYIFSLDENVYIKPFVESDTFFCFEILMQEIKPVFMMHNINYSQLFITMQIRQINDILNQSEPDLLNYFKKVNLVMDVFLMRWLMVLFAHEFTFEGSISFWDRVFTQKNKMKFICYISVAILVINKKKLMKMEMEEIVVWAQEFGAILKNNNIDEIVKMAFDIKAGNKKSSKDRGFFGFFFK
jgi:hypothetical protein